MAYVEPKRLKACVEYGGPIHYTWQKDWLTYLLTDEKEYFWPFPDSMIYANGLKDFDKLVRTAPAMSLKEQGWLSKPNAPMLSRSTTHRYCERLPRNTYSLPCSRFPFAINSMSAMEFAINRPKG